MTLTGVESIVFDLDGTLVALRGRRGASAENGSGGVRQSGLARRLWMATELPTNYLMMGLERSGLEPALRGLIDHGRRLKGVAASGSLDPIDGAAELLSDLAGRFRLGVITNRARRDALQFVRGAGFDRFLQVVTTRSDVWRLKPHPAPVLLTAEKLGVDVGGMLMVGDMPSDIHAARRAGARAVGVLSGFGTEAELKRAGAQVILPSVCELPSIIRDDDDRGETHDG